MFGAVIVQDFMFELHFDGMIGVASVTLIPSHCSLWFRRSIPKVWSYESQAAVTTIVQKMLKSEPTRKYSAKPCSSISLKRATVFNAITAASISQLCVIMPVAIIIRSRAPIQRPALVVGLGKFIIEAVKPVTLKTPRQTILPNQVSITKAIAV